MQVDGADEAERRLPQPGDPHAGDPDQDHLPLELGWIEVWIEDVGSRNITGQWRCEMEDRTAPPVRRDCDLADPDGLHTLWAGIDHDRLRSAPDTHNLEGKAWNDGLPM